MSLFKDIDIYKAIIIGALVLLPGGGVLVWMQDEEVARAEAQLAKARQRGGVLEQIGTLDAELATIQRNTTGGAGGERHLLYFSRRVLETTGNAGWLGANDFEIGNEESRRVSALKAEDREVDLSFRDNRTKKPLNLPRDFISALIFNCESQSKTWKLRELRIRNADEDLETGRGAKAVPRTVDDIWSVEKMTYVRRQPESRGR